MRAVKETVVSLFDPHSFAIVSAGIFAGAVVSGLVGFAFSAVAGAILVNDAKTFLTGALPEVWLYALGALFILVTLFLPRGLVGLMPAAAEAK